MAFLTPVKDRLYALDPRLGLRVHAWYYLVRRSEPEIRLLRLLCDRAQTSIDVGAHIGIYTYFMRRHSSDVLAIEPNPQFAALLRRAFETRVAVHEVAFSDRAGVARLKIPSSGGSEEPSRATIEPANPLFAGAGREVEVRCATLDQLAPSKRVGFVKIDVEGHELSALRGATGVLARDQPSLLVEAEERHAPGSIAAVTSLLRSLGYRGYFLLRGRITDIDQFEPAVHQRGNPYVYNFVFAARDSVKTALTRRP